MNKRELARIPFRMASDADLSLAARTEGKANFFHVRPIPDKDMLALSIYSDRDLRDGVRTPHACVYLGRDEYITRVYTDSSKMKWLTGRLETVARLHWGEAAVFLDEESMRALSAFYAVERAALENIHCHQRRILSARLAIRYQQIKDRIDRHMALIPELPEDFDGFIHSSLKNRYMFYTYADRKAIMGCCTGCRREVMIPRPKHNQIVRCPSCGATATAKARRKYTHPLRDNGRVCLPQRTAEGFALRYFDVQRREHTSGRVEFLRWEEARVLFGDAVNLRLRSVQEHH